MTIKRTKHSLSLNYFVGIDISDHIKEEIYCFIQNNMKQFNPFIQWIGMNEYHITLAYLGKITEEQRLRLIAVADQIKVPPLSIGIKGIGFYPPGKKPKSLWIGVDQGREAMNVFVEYIRSEIINKSGLIPKDFFYPHITIGRVKYDKSPEMNNLFSFIHKNWDYPFGKFKINSFHLYRITKNGYQHNHEIKLTKRPYLIIE